MVLTSSDIQCKILIIIINTTTHWCYHEALVDVVCLLQGFPLALCLLCHLAAGKVDKVDLAVPGQLANCWWWFVEVIWWHRLRWSWKFVISPLARLTKLNYPCFFKLVAIEVTNRVSEGALSQLIVIFLLAKLTKLQWWWVKLFGRYKNRIHLVM